jgi:hypothetical protein
MREADMTQIRFLKDAADVTARVLELVEEVHDGWFANDDRIDWEDFMDRLCGYGLLEAEPWEFREYGTPAEAKIRRHVRDIRNNQ